MDRTTMYEEDYYAGRLEVSFNLWLECIRIVCRLNKAWSSETQQFFFAVNFYFGDRATL